MPRLKSPARQERRRLKRQKSPWSSVPKAPDELTEIGKRFASAPDLLEAAREDDRRWFEANPGRRFHLRATTPHERYADPKVRFVLIEQIVRGVRLKRGLPFHNRFARLADFNTDEQCAALREEWDSGLLVLSPPFELPEAFDTAA
jgi:hypothetical protein